MCRGSHHKVDSILNTKFKGVFWDYMYMLTNSVPFYTILEMDEKNKTTVTIYIFKTNVH